MANKETRILDLVETQIVVDNRHLFDYAERLLQHFQRFKDIITEQKLIPNPPRNHHWLILTNSAQAELNFVSACELLAKGHVVECFILLRTSWEYIFHIAFMLKDPEGRAQDWIDYDAIYRIKALKCRDRLGSTPPDRYEAILKELISENKSAIDKFTRPKSLQESDLLKRKYYVNWTRHESIRDIAKCVDQVKLYDTFYEQFTQHVHPTRECWNRYIQFSPDGELSGFGPVLTPKKEEIEEVIASGAHSILLLVELLSADFKMDLGDDHSKLCDELKEFYIHVASP